MRIFTFIFFSCVLASAVCGQTYSINRGYDFATGENLEETRSGNKLSGKLISQKRTEGSKKLYEKYHLSYPEPLPRMVCGTVYTFAWCTIQRRNRDWNFWRWKYHVLQNRPSIFWDGAAPELIFFQILKEGNPSEADAHKIFAATVALIKTKADHEIIEKYLRGQYDFLMRNHYRKCLSDYLKSPGETTSRKLEYYRRGVFRLLLSEREKWPSRLPDHFYLAALQERYNFSDYREFFRDEYQRDPSLFHAVLLAYKTQNPDQLLKELHDRNLIEMFLRQVMPEKLPPLPPPLPPNRPIPQGQYSERDYRDSPYRTALLQWCCHHSVLKQYWDQLLKQQLKDFSGGFTP